MKNVPKKISKTCSFTPQQLERIMMTAHDCSRSVCRQVEVLVDFGFKWMEVMSKKGGR